MHWTVTTHQLTVYALHFEGRIDASVVAPALRDALRQMSNEDRHHFIIDLCDVTFIDSTGLGMLVSLLRASRSAGGDVVLVVPGDSDVQRILSLVRFDLVFTIFETPEEALAAFRITPR